jgi:hypothetical protein
MKSFQKFHNTLCKFHRKHIRRRMTSKTTTDNEIMAESNSLRFKTAAGDVITDIYSMKTLEVNSMGSKFTSQSTVQQVEIMEPQLIPNPHDLLRPDDRANLQNMPVEVILHILKDVPDYMMVSLGFTCHRLRAILVANDKPYKFYSLGTTEQTIFKRELRRMYYCRSCTSTQKGKCTFADAERHKLLEQRQLHCSACEIEHSSLLFSDHQQQQPSAVRKCIGSEGYLRLSSDKTLSFDQLRLQLIDCSSTESSQTIAIEHQESGPLDTSSSINITVRQSISVHPMTGKEKGIRLHIRRNGGIHAHITHEELVEFLRSGVIGGWNRACPHLSFQSRDVKDLIEIKDCACFKDHTGRRLSMSCGTYPLGIWCAHCRAKVCFSREGSAHRESFIWYRSELEVSTDSLC